MLSNVFGSLQDSFMAFNQNAIYCLEYVMSKNIWFLLIAVAALAAVIMMLKEEMDYSVNEEQNII